MWIDLFMSRKRLLDRAEVTYPGHSASFVMIVTLYIYDDQGDILCAVRLDCGILIRSRVHD